MSYVVHFMKFGMTSCGLAAGEQREWPDNHRWVTTGYEADVNCPTCVACLKPVRNRELKTSEGKTKTT